ncbi:MAG: preprotein translocase subunit YajC [Alphaproteobacteria bacterium]|nr:preprotein translocase subunit YajC [Alphaproteobacteria bacterium]
MDLLLPPAYAQSTSIAGFDFMSLLPLVLIFAVFYFFLIRPQQKKAQQQKELLAGLRRGDKVVTNGGLIGVISKVISDQEVQVEIAENVRVRVVRAMVSQILSKTEPVSEDTHESPSSEDKKSTAVKGSAGRKKKSS